MRTFLTLFGAVLLSIWATGSAIADESSPLIQVGVARVDITPTEPIRLVGYGGRRTEATSVASKIWAKALAIGSDEQKPCVLMTVELIGAPGYLIDPLAERLNQKVGLDRARLPVCATHTHTGGRLAVRRVLSEAEGRIQFHLLVTYPARVRSVGGVRDGRDCR